MSDYNALARIVGRYDGVNVTAKGTVDLKFRLPYDELTNYIVALQMLNNTITVSTQIPPEDEMKLGDYMIKSLNIGGDGEAKLCLSTTTEFAEMDRVNILSNHIGVNVVITMMADIEVEEENYSDDVWGSEDTKEAIKRDSEDMQGEWCKEEEPEEWQDNESWGDDDENDNDGWE